MTDPDHHAMMEEHVSYGQRIQDLESEVERLEAVCHDAFMAMCAFRDGGDLECFQDAIDILGIQSNLAWDDPRRKAGR
jgi:hypothetical protein